MSRYQQEEALQSRWPNSMFCDDGKLLLPVLFSAVATGPVVPNQGHMCPPGSTWQCRETFLAVTAGWEGATNI